MKTQEEEDEDEEKVSLEPFFSSSNSCEEFFSTFTSVFEPHTFVLEKGGEKVLLLTSREEMIQSKKKHQHQIHLKKSSEISEAQGTRSLSCTSHNTLCVCMSPQRRDLSFDVSHCISFCSLVNGHERDEKKRKGGPAKKEEGVEEEERKKLTDLR